MLFWEAHQTSLHRAANASPSLFSGEHSDEQPVIRQILVNVDIAAQARWGDGWMSSLVMRMGVDWFYPAEYPGGFVPSACFFCAFETPRGDDLGLGVSRWSP